MTIINGKVFRAGNSFAIRIPKAFVNGGIVNKGEYRNAVLLPRWVDEEEAKIINAAIEEYLRQNLRSDTKIDLRTLVKEAGNDPGGI